MTQPESSSGEWWEKEPYAEECYGHAGSTGYETHYDLPAILKEQRRLVIEEYAVRKQNLYTFMAALIWHLNNPQGTKMCIPNDVYAALDKRLARLDHGRVMSEGEIMEAVTRRKSL